MRRLQAHVSPTKGRHKSDPVHGGTKMSDSLREGSPSNTLVRDLPLASRHTEVPVSCVSQYRADCHTSPPSLVRGGEEGWPVKHPAWAPVMVLLSSFRNPPSIDPWVASLRLSGRRAPAGRRHSYRPGRFMLLGEKESPGDGPLELRSTVTRTKFLRKMTLGCIRMSGLVCFLRVFDCRKYCRY